MPQGRIPPSISKFTVPRDGEIYISTIRERCHHLIKTGIWRGIDHLKLDSWLKNFESQEEQYFAACILDALIYRSPEQTTSLLYELFERLIPQILRENSYTGNALQGCLAHLRCHPDQVGREIIIVPVIRNNDPPTKSGPLIARMYRRILEMEDQHMLWPWQLKNSPKVADTNSIIFIDDFIGTGRQFRRFIEDFKLKELLETKFCIYASLAAHEKGIQHIKSKFPSLHIASSELITSKLDLFSAQSNAFKDNVNTPETAKMQYSAILKRIGFSNSSSATGFGRLGIVYGFDHATPNNSIPLLWWSNQNWKPLLER